MISEKQYYSEKRVSSSSLKWFENSPKFFFKQLSEEIKQIKLSFLELGKKIHMSILEPELFEKNYIYLEYETPKSENQKQFCEEYVKLKKDKKSTIKDASIKAYSKAYNIVGKSPTKVEEEALKLQKSLKKYIEYLTKSVEYKDVLNKSTADLISDLKNEIALHKKANELLLVNNELDPDYETHNEYVIFWEYGKVDKVSCKSMIDRFIIDKKNKVIKLVDIKTTSDYIVNNFRNNSSYDNFLKLIKERSIYKFDVDLNSNDNVLTLSTCYSKSERVVMHAKLIKQESNK